MGSLIGAEDCTGATGALLCIATSAGLGRAASTRWRMMKLLKPALIASRLVPATTRWIASPGLRSPCTAGARRFLTVFCWNMMLTPLCRAICLSASLIGCWRMVMTSAQAGTHQAIANTVPPSAYARQPWTLPFIVAPSSLRLLPVAWSITRSRREPTSGRDNFFQLARGER